MSRYVKNFKMDQPIDVVSIVMEDFIYHNKFHRTDWNSEMVYNMTDSNNTDIYFKWSYAGGLFHMEAWIRGLGGREMDLNGGYKGASRAAFKQKLEILECNLKSHCGHIEAGGIGFDPVGHDTFDTHIDIDEEESYKNSTGYEFSYGSDRLNVDPRQTKALMIAIMGLIFGQMGIGIILEIMALVTLKGTEASKLKKTVTVIATLGIIIGIISVISIFASVAALNIYGNLQQYFDIIMNGVD